METVMTLAATSLFSWWLYPTNWLYVACAALGLGFVIFVHELGHFLVAKMCGVKCEKFYVGFDPPMSIGPIQLPRTLFRKQWGETEYGIGIIPLGGYVKMLGQDDNPANAAREAERTRIAASGGDPNAECSLDPRSYPAKNVLQRMAIISAGVIMNIIFAVIFATYAYRSGVEYTPCSIGGVLAGDPAWQAGIQPGDQVIQIGRDGRRDEQLRFRKDLVPAVFLAGNDGTVDLLLRRNGKEFWITARPSKSHPRSDRATIGVVPETSLRLLDNTPFFPSSAASRAEPPLQAGDLVTAVEIDGARHATESSYQVDLWLQRFPDRPASLYVTRAPSKGQPQQELRSVVPPQKLRSLGIAMSVGKIMAVKVGSPAEAAGIQVGDEIQQVEGQPIADPMELETFFRAHIGQRILVTVRRKDDVMDLAVQPTLPETPQAVLSRADCPIACESVGIAFHVEPTITSVAPDGPAARSGLQPGDIITRAVFVAPPPSSDGTEPMLSVPSEYQFTKEKRNWPFFTANMQLTPATVAELDYLRGSKTETCRLEIAESQQFSGERGLVFGERAEIRRAGTWGEAIRLGWRETKESAGLVLSVLKRLTNKDTLNNLGGPLTIGYAATMEAMQGLPQLLTFLTALSANLAVVNLLPIPVLDGGHLVFLTWEAIFRKPMNERIVMGLTLAGLSLILGLMLFVIGKDVFMFLQLNPS